ncbi:hypothetical protein [Mangrovibrevibacter kandeliae]|uniref:hypothetical protein n=1 Tax=Mangrovibrevibacter kandeliae TaxID=2968473 RepID=UPI0021177C7C|nr:MULTISPECIES: hypothetical protein [unclassified Aurantimonas]MCQ8783242.1 hypothetical protein [Aurantimonas sp. CSK15Z-1]MCW4116243.1 hypothetical protein [Aurantimonas sp. MSK8Z-1]
MDKLVASVSLAALAAFLFVILGPAREPDLVLIVGLVALMASYDLFLALAGRRRR